MNLVVDGMTMPESIEYTCSQGRSRYIFGPLVAHPCFDVQLSVRGSSRIALHVLDEKHRVCVDFIQARGVLQSLIEKYRGISCGSPSGDDQVVGCC